MDSTWKSGSRILHQNFSPEKSAIFGRFSIFEIWTQISNLKSRISNLEKHSIGLHSDPDWTKFIVQHYDFLEVSVDVTLQYSM